MKLKTMTAQSLEAAERKRLFNVFETLLAVKKEVKSGLWALKWIDNKVQLLSFDPFLRSVILGRIPIFF